MSKLSLCYTQAHKQSGMHVVGDFLRFFSQFFSFEPVADSFFYSIWTVTFLQSLDFLDQIMLNRLFHDFWLSIRNQVDKLFGS